VLRLEKVYHVYTREIDESTNPFEAGLEKAVKLEKGDFVGRAALRKLKESGLTRKLVGFSAGHGGQVFPPKSTIMADDQPVGYVTVMAASPTIGETIGLGYVSIEHSEIGTPLMVAAAGEQTDVKVVRTPFFDPEGTRIRG
jgi:aminomethyltransferase